MQILFILFSVVRISAVIIQGNTDANRTVISLINDVSILRFGNETTTDYFRLLDLDGEHLLIGARDVVYNVSIATFAEMQSIKWSSKQNVVNECLMKGKPKDACHNFVRVLASDGSSGVLVCGTNAFQPMCRQYDREKYGEYRQISEFSGLGIAPYDPNYNSTFLRDGDLLYAGTVSDFSGADPLIHRRNVSKLVELGIRTERNDIKFLNEPQFAGSFKDEKYVYLWFREQAGELESCNRAIYSRVARLCRSDMGGPRPYSNEWTSFVKARLNCSIPGDYPFYFDQIEAISPPVSGRYSVKEENARLVYAVFRSPLAGVSTSAICAFDLTHILKVFSRSSYRSQANSRSPWTPLHDDILARHRPGTCVKDSRTLSEEAVAFVRSSPLVDDAVHNYFGAPLSIHSGSGHFTQIAVEAQVRALDGRYYDVIFVGTDEGTVFKLVNLAGAAAKTGHPSHHIYTLRVTNIEAISPPVSGRYSVKEENARLVYAVFRSPLAGVSTSAICAFDLTHILKVFSRSSYRSQANSRSPWTPLHDDILARHRPGTCVKDSRTLSEEAVAFVRSSPLVDDAVHNYFGAPLSIHSGSGHFTQIAVEAQVRALDGRYYDVIFVGTDEGTVFKLVNLAGAAAKTGHPSHHIYTLRVTNEAIRNMMLYEGKTSSSLYNGESPNYVIVVSDRSVVRVPASKCSVFASCVQCVSLRDPHCVWDFERSKCTYIDERPGRYEQDIVEGRGEQLCANVLRAANSLSDIPIADQPRLSHLDVPLTLSLTSKTSNCSCADKVVEMCSSSGSSSEISSESTVSSLGEQVSVIVLCATIGTLSLLIGFFVGLFYWRCVPSLKSKGSACSLSSPTPQPVYSGAPLVRPSTILTAPINAYESTPKFNTFAPRPQSPISLQVGEVGTPQGRVAWGTSTLPKDYRVKRMYL
ncbi:Semaphorin-1A [Toxocara canis]|uniref:Semaphorin-1A n=1 Tax=Toxocara canis TaxID=6265 RepID=A0A0B2V600_TOXCA|nr:Semaphorin-1A [Toxocara canis]